MTELSDLKLEIGNLKLGLVFWNLRTQIDDWSKQISIYKLFLLTWIKISERGKIESKINEFDQSLKKLVKDINELTPNLDKVLEQLLIVQEFEVEDLKRLMEDAKSYLFEFSKVSFEFRKFQNLFLEIWGIFYKDTVIPVLPTPPPIDPKKFIDQLDYIR